MKMSSKALLTALALAAATLSTGLARDTQPDPAEDPVKACIRNATREFFLRQQSLRIAIAAFGKQRAEKYEAASKDYVQSVLKGGNKNSIKREPLYDFEDIVAQYPQSVTLTDRLAKNLASDSLRVPSAGIYYRMDKKNNYKVAIPFDESPILALPRGDQWVLGKIDAVVLQASSPTIDVGNITVGADLNINIFFAADTVTAIDKNTGLASNLETKTYAPERNLSLSEPFYFLRKTMERYIPRGTYETGDDPVRGSLDNYSIKLFKCGFGLTSG